MKKILTLLAVAAMFGFVSCKEKETDPVPTTATITANDVTVDVGKTVSIGATTNSSAAISYACDNAAVATVTASGEVTGVAAGSANITLKVAEVAGKFTAAEKTIKVTVNEDLPPTPPTPTAKGITIDGDFSDWADVATGIASEDDEAPLKEFKVAFDKEYLYFYHKRNNNPAMWGGGYFYLAVDADNNVATGMTDANGNTYKANDVLVARDRAVRLETYTPVAL